MLKCQRCAVHRRTMRHIVAPDPADCKVSRRAQRVCSHARTHAGAGHRMPPADEETHHSDSYSVPTRSWLTNTERSTTRAQRARSHRGGRTWNQNNTRPQLPTLFTALSSGMVMLCAQAGVSRQLWASPAATPQECRMCSFNTRMCSLDDALGARTSSTISSSFPFFSTDAAGPCCGLRLGAKPCAQPRG